MVGDLLQYWPKHAKRRKNIRENIMVMASICLDPGSESQDAYVGNCLFNLVANISISAVPKKVVTDLAKY